VSLSCVHVSCVMWSWVIGPARVPYHVSYNACVMSCVICLVMSCVI
jgi:hypothetical protein